MTIFSGELFRDVVGKVVMHFQVLEGCTVFAIYRDDVVHSKTETVKIYSGTGAAFWHR